MKRKELADYPFDKEKFGKELNKAFGARSQTDFCRDAGLSFSYVNRYVNLKTDTTPTLGTIKKIAVAAEGVTYEELLLAAGYDPKKYEHDLPRKPQKKDFLHPVWKSVANSDMDWRIEADGYRDDAPFEIIIEKSEVKKWYFIPVEKEDVTREEIQSLLLSRGEFTSESKISFVTDDWKTYEKLKTFEFPILSLYISVVKVIGDAVETEEAIKTSQSTDVTVMTKSEKQPFSIR